MRPFFPAVLLFLAVSGNIHADPVYPGDIFLTSTAWEGEAALTEKTLGTRLTFSLEGIPVRNIIGEFNVGYRWRERDDTIDPLPNTGISAGYRIALPPFISLTPLAGFSLALLPKNGNISPFYEVSASVRVSILLAGRSYLTLTPSFSMPVIIGGENRFSISVGTRKEIPWFKPVTETKNQITVFPSRFSPDNDGLDDKASLYLETSRPKSVKTWKVTIYSPDGTLYREFGGKGIPPSSLEWDGTSGEGSEAEPAFDYRVEFETTDTLGRKKKSETVITVDILVIAEGDHYKIRVPDIVFPSYSFELSEKESQSLLRENRATLERIASLFTRFPEYSLVVEGHANAVNWNDPKKLKAEQEEVLIPLSKKRADTVKQALVLLGVAQERIRTSGVGGANPVSPFSDIDNIWKNRRVEFILSRQR